MGNKKKNINALLDTSKEVGLAVYVLAFSSEPVILPAVLYGHEIWSFILREHRLGACENRVLRRTSGSKWEEGRLGKNA